MIDAQFQEIRHQGVLQGAADSGMMKVIANETKELAKLESEIEQHELRLVRAQLEKRQRDISERERRVQEEARKQAKAEAELNQEQAVWTVLWLQDTELLTDQHLYTVVEVKMDTLDDKSLL